MASGRSLSAELTSGDAGKLEGTGPVNVPLDVDEKREDKHDTAKSVSESRDLEKGGKSDTPLSANDNESHAGLDTRQNSATASGAHVCHKALEAGFPNVKRNGDRVVVDWDGPNDPCNPLK